jgi:hypothetical protein
MQMHGAHHCADQPTFCLALCGQAIRQIYQDLIQVTPTPALRRIVRFNDGLIGRCEPVLRLSSQPRALGLTYLSHAPLPMPDRS